MDKQLAWLVSTGKGKLGGNREQGVTCTLEIASPLLSFGHLPGKLLDKRACNAITKKKFNKLKIDQLTF